MKSKTEAPFGVLISHTSKQGNVYERPVAVLRVGGRVRFLTGLYGDKLPWWLMLAAQINERVARLIQRVVQKRAHPALPGRNVVSTSGVVAEWVRLGLGWISFSDKFHDALTAFWILLNPRLSDYVVFHGFQDSCRLSLLAARRRNLVTLLEVILPPLRLMDCQVGSRYNEVALQIAVESKRVSAQLLNQARGADRIIVQSSYGIGVLRNLGIPEENISIVDLGVDTSRFVPASMPHLPTETIRLLFVGQIGFRKGIDILSDAIDMVPDVPLEVTAAGHVVDEVGHDCLARCTKIRYAGVVSDDKLLELYQTHDWLVIPSRSEGGCNVVMEALSCGLPCIVAEGAVSVVSHSLDGWVIPNNDASALAAVLKTLPQLSASHRAWRDRARAKAVQHDWVHFSRSLNALYNDAALAKLSASNTRSQLL